MKTIILGPPGTGKTTTLLDLVDEFLRSGIDSKRIGYFSFTRKAAEEASSRAAEKFNLDAQDDLPFFRTLHSLAFRTLGVKREQVMQTRDYKDFGSKVGISVRLQHANNSDSDGTFTSDNEYLSMINKARVTERDVMDLYDDNNHYLDIERDTLYLLDRELKRYKQEKGMIDYADMLERFVEQDVSPSFDVLFIDEAQDLSPLQWRMVRSLWAKAGKTYIAGDDDQAIFKWAGADVDTFIALKEEVDQIRHTRTVLSEFLVDQYTNYHKSIIRTCTANRYEKAYKPREEIGKLNRYSDITQVDMSQG
jgi:DNA helicase-2/ATP-dependent DNA helicase PcrA